jgi:alginate O-acetyltransferase complex protein AlgI
LLFNSIAYLVFLPVVVCLFWLTPARFRAPLLLVASYFFYMWWKPIYGLLIVTLTAINYFFGLQLGGRMKGKRWFLIVALATNLLVLGYFKYAYFTWDIMNQIRGWLHQPTMEASFNIILPLGISFFVFEFIHYIVDVYKGHEPIRSPINFALFPSFFPTQIAGPIKRYQDFIPQLARTAGLTLAEFNDSVELILVGLFKKVVIADNLALVVNRCYAHTADLNSADLWLASAAFLYQVYNDFSGYSDIARGSAGLLGFKVPLNFQLPLVAHNWQDLWKRWHITLSLWLKEYIYQPLGGGKNGELMTCRNLMITMTLCGLWHGAGDHFVLWGAAVGLVCVLHRMWLLLAKKVPSFASVRQLPGFLLFARLLTFAFFTLTIAVFRSQNWMEGVHVLGKMLFVSNSSFPASLQPTILATTGSFFFNSLPLLLLVLFIAMVLLEKREGAKEVRFEFLRAPAFKPVYLAAIIIALLVGSPEATPQFVYFQF